MRQTLTTHAKSIAGIALLGLGCFVFYEHLSHAAALARHLCSVPCQAPGGVADAILSAWRAYPPDQKRFAHAFLRYLLISSWPLLLVWAGTALSRDAFAEGVRQSSVNPGSGERLPENKSEKKICRSVDLAAPRSTSK